MNKLLFWMNWVNLYKQKPIVTLNMTECVYGQNTYLVLLILFKYSSWHLLQFFSSSCSVGLTYAGVSGACVSVWPLLYDFTLPCLYVYFCVSFALCKWIIRTHGAPNRKFFIYLWLRCSYPRCLSSVIHVFVVVFFYWLDI
jgi:hypothetical protein